MTCRDFLSYLWLTLLIFVGIHSLCSACLLTLCTACGQCKQGIRAVQSREIWAYVHGTDSDLEEQEEGRNEMVQN